MDIVVKLRDKAVLLKDRHEGAGLQHLTLGGDPAHQRLGADDLVRRGISLRLEEHLELAVCERIAHGVLDKCAEAVLLLRVAGLVIDRDGRDAVHAADRLARAVCLLDSRRHRVLLVLEAVQAAPHVELQIGIETQHRCVGALQDHLDARLCALAILIVEHHDEVRAADPCQQLVRPQHRRHGGREHAQDLVAHLVAPDLVQIVELREAEVCHAAACARVLRHVSRRIRLELLGGELTCEGILRADALHELRDIGPAYKALLLSVLAGHA